MTDSAVGWVAIIDDDDAVRRALTRVLRVHGIVAESYGSADDYVKRSCGGLPACLVLDVQLRRGMSSFELLDQMDALGDRVPVIFVTGQAEPGPELCARYPELRTLLRKPFAAECLIARVRHHLQESDSVTL